MSDRPTPETDSIIRNAQTADHPPTRLAATLTVKCGKLERERDEAMELLASEKITRNHIIKRSVEVERERDEAREKYATEATEHMLAINKLCNERDEARDVLQAVIKTGKRLERERDEAREHLKLSVVWQSLRDSQDEVLRLTFENRELRIKQND